MPAAQRSTPAPPGAGRIPHSGLGTVYVKAACLFFTPPDSTGTNLVFGPFASISGQCAGRKTGLSLRRFHDRPIGPPIHGRLAATLPPQRSEPSRLTDYFPGLLSRRGRDRFAHHRPPQHRKYVGIVDVSGNVPSRLRRWCRGRRRGLRRPRFPAHARKAAPDCSNGWSYGTSESGICPLPRLPIGSKAVLSEPLPQRRPVS